MRAIAVLLSVLVLSPVAGVDYQTGDEDWRDVEVDTSAWTDGPEFEGSPMDNPRPGDAVLIIDVEYKPSHLASEVQGQIVIELFEEWAPNTTANMIKNVENDIYNGIFFHRVIDDFVTQAGDPTCKTAGIYPATSLTCGSGGSGQTIALEHHTNLSHVDGAIGMARSQDPDSADSQWYIAETEAHGLDPENRDDEGYATFGIVRNGMSHVRAIALVPTTDDPSGEEQIMNPASSAGRPIWEVHISNVEMIGVVPYDEEKVVESQSFLSTLSGKVTISLSLIIVVIAGYLAFNRSREEEPDAILLDANED
ncbi:MAG: peptidylprolyl isomerase [Candidatus Poseidoniales archaeon]|nr:MAG: peptidylprolyl isomerase [Candidatus Poseidoniales archaeon]